MLTNPRSPLLRARALLGGEGPRHEELDDQHRERDRDGVGHAAHGAHDLAVVVRDPTLEAFMLVTRAEQSGVEFKRLLGSLFSSL